MKTVYRIFTITIEHDGAGTGNNAYTWVVDRADGSNYDISEFEYETEDEALESAKECIDGFYDGD